MNELSVFTPYVMPVMSMVAAFTVVSVATLRILRPSYPRKTAIVLSLGVTIMALVGTAPIIFPLQKHMIAELQFPNGSALMLLPFLTLAISRLLCELLIAANGTVSERGPKPTAMETAVAGTTTAPPAKEDKNVASNTKPRGRPKKQQAKEGQRDKQVEQSEGKQKLASAVAATKEGRQDVNTL